MPDIVVILDSDVFSLCLFEEEIESIVWSEIFLTFYELDLLTFREILRNIFTRSIIENEDFCIRICLIDARLECISEVFSRIVGDNEDGDKGIIVHDFL